METTKVEFTIEVPKGQNIEEKIRDKLQDTEIIEIDSKSGRLVVGSAQSWPSLLSRIEDTGLRAALTGYGGSAAVSIVDKGSADDSVKGVIRFTGATPDSKNLVVDGVIDGLQPEKLFQIKVHECGDLSQGCESLGDMYGASRLGATKADPQGRISFRYSADQFAISDLIGRSVVVAEEEKRLACGIIARAAGINENFKKICACDGITLWDERNVPAAGGTRSTFTKSNTRPETN